TGCLARPNAARSDGPFRTLERARDAVRALRQAGALPTGGLVVELQPGTWQLDQTFTLTAEDSGTAEAPITYQAKPGGEVRLTAGKSITSWQAVTDRAVLAQLSPEARRQVRQADLKAAGITDYGQMGGGFGQSGLPGIELFFNDQPMTISRYPNEGFMKLTGVEGATPVDVRGTKGTKEGIFAYDDERPARWLNEPEPWVLGYWFWDWAEGRHKIAKIEPEAKRITLAPPFHSFGYRKGQWFYGFNLLCEIDQPGEWFLDRQSGVLYFWPPSPLARGRAVVSVLPTVARLDGASHVTLRGMVIEAARAHGVVVNNCTAAAVEACTIRNVGSWAVRVEGGSGCRVVGCDITATGDGGISLQGGDRKTLRPAAHLAENNHIHHWSRWNRMYRPGIHLHGVGNIARHNLLNDSPHTAVGFSGNDHRIELNEIHSVCFESNDAGAIYSGRDWSQRGTVVRHNYMHHINGFEGRGCVGVYFDDMLSGNHIIGNVFREVTRAAFIGGGRDCRVENNIFIDCRPAVHVDARAVGWAKDSVAGTMTNNLKAVPYTQPPWSTRWPELLTVLDDEPGLPKGNVIARNVCVGGKWDEFEGKARPLLRIEDSLIDEDPKFVMPERGNFQLRDDSPAYKLGFQRVPFEIMGLYRSPLRASWPVQHSVRPTQKPPAPPARGPVPVFKAPNLATPPVVDGKLEPAEWLGLDPAKAMVLEQEVDGRKTSPRSLAWLGWDDQALYIAFDNAVASTPPLRTGAQWGQDDAVEVALRDGLSNKSAPLLVLRGFPNGQAVSSDEAGAPESAVKRVGEALTYRAAVVNPARWVAEYRLPWAALGIDPAKSNRLQFNLAVRKSAQPLWQMWRGTTAQTWRVDEAGILELARP
ncbi:MAG: right-handed parallel beta-helix repeat-containing protein, partial [Armatimonadetes bacterium]|nr:right-handed parallel beta-helix repeat-containing protein [Armatimonadota bacterium]